MKFLKLRKYLLNESTGYSN